MHDGTLILIAGSLLALGIGATLLAGRLRVPGLVLFLVLGMAIGSDLRGRTGHPDNPRCSSRASIARALRVHRRGG